MLRVVLKTLTGEQVSTVEVPPEELRSFLIQIATRRDLCPYIDGKRVPDTVMGSLFVDPVMTYGAAPVLDARELAPAVPMTVQDVKTLSDALSTVANDMTRTFQKLQDFWLQAAEQQLEMQRDMADEAVRQRKLTAQCLGDIDLMHRAVKTAELSESLAERKARTGHAGGAAPQTLAAARSVGVGDYLRGARRLFGEKKK